MKTVYSLLKGVGLVSSLAFIIVFAPAMQAAEGSVKGGTQLLNLTKAIVTAEDAAQAKPGDTVAMACPKCKTILVSKVTQVKGQRLTSKEAEHLCPGCGVKYETGGLGKARIEKIVHTCNKCGSTDAFCCVMKKGDTPMEEKKP